MLDFIENKFIGRDKIVRRIKNSNDNRCEK